MESKIYIVTRIEGEYAYLLEEGKCDSEELFIAMALLPIGTDVGTTLRYVVPDFEILN